MYSTSGGRSWGSYHNSDYHNLNHRPYTKMNSKLIIDLNVKYKAVKVSEENVGENLRHLGLGREILDIMPKA